MSTSETESKLEAVANETEDELTNTTKKENVCDKKDEISPSQSASTSSEKAAGESKITGKIVRGTKRIRLDIGESSDKKELKDDPEAEAKLMRSLKRSCELWSMEDKNTFFKALNEYGKDFDALQTYFQSQGKKKGISEKMIKNKEQIRHFYYRTWLKISKHLKFSEDVKKTSQELYGLINYGELRRKLPRMHEKVQMRLNELVYYGSMQVRLRGKTIRIKTPICRALRKLNQLEDWQEDIKLPSRVTIELRPGNNYTWWTIQGLAMNPRVRTLVPIQRRLSSILSFLQQRWRPWKPKIPENENFNINENKVNKLIRVAPLQSSKISIPAVNLGEYLTSNSVSFNSYEKRMSLKSSKIELLGATQYFKGVGKKGIKKYKSDKRLGNRFEETLPDNSDVDTAESSVGVITEKSSTLNNVEKSTAEPQIEINGFPGRENIERIKLGWNVEEANTITVGDLFLMFGRESKIILEYWWELPSSHSSGSKSSSFESLPEVGLSSALQKLLSIAKLSYSTIKGYDLSGSNETVVSSRTPYPKDSTFRTPFLPQPYQKADSTETFRIQLDRYKTRSTRRGKFFRNRNLVVQRVMPATPESTQPILYPQVQNIPVGDKTVTLTIISPNEQIVEDNSAENLNSIAENCDKPFQALGGGGVTNSTSSITSAMQILKEGEQQWLNSEVADFSLSSFLGQLESPIKTENRVQGETRMLEIVRPSSDVGNMHSIIGENGVDYVAKFANYASQIVSSEDQKK